MFYSFFTSGEDDFDRIMTFMEKIWRLLIEMVQGVQKDLEKKG